MKFLAVFALTLAGLANSAQGAKVVPQENLNCTADINIWGVSSDCGCRGKTRYDERIGYCVRGAYKEITVSGKIVANLVAIGGETSGIALETWEEPSRTYELILKRPDFEKLSTLNGLPFEVVGDLIEIPGVEAAPRTSIIVKELHWLD